MKTKTLLFIGAVAIVTLSFTFASVNREHKKEVKETTVGNSYTEPAGGFVSEDKIRS